MPRTRSYLCFSDGKPCGCGMSYSDDPKAYIEAHPNKKGANGETFNDSIDAARRLATKETPAR